MNKPRALLIGTAEQSSMERWTRLQAIGIYDPYGITREQDTPVPLLNTPVYDPARVDAVVFLVPNYKKLLVPLVAEALASGLRTLIIKARLSEYAELAPLRALPDDARARLYVGEQYRFLPGAAALLRAVRAGELGRVEYAGWRARIPMPSRAPWMDAYAHLIAEDLSYHHFGYLAALGLIDDCEVSARSYRPGWMERDRGYFQMLAWSRAGVTLSYDMRWGCADGIGNFFGELTLEGERGALTTDGERATFYPRGGEPISLPVPVPEYAGWEGIADGFADMLLGRADALAAPLTFDGFDAAFRLMYAAVEAERGGGIVRTREL